MAKMQEAMLRRVAGATQLTNGGIYLLVSAFYGSRMDSRNRTVSLEDTMVVWLLRGVESSGFNVGVNDLGESAGEVRKRHRKLATIDGCILKALRPPRYGPARTATMGVPRCAIFTVTLTPGSG
jgi:hypothetical protein